MKALLKTAHGVGIANVPDPILRSPHDVLIRIAVSGLCRTDIYVADGLIRCKNPLVLGHEFSGIVEQIGRSVQGVHPGDRVTVMPFFASGVETGQGSQASTRPEMLGVDHDGSFAEYIVVPSSTVFPIPDDMPLKTAAYMEPVAASLGCLNANIGPEQHGLIYGDNRISRLTERILRARGFKDITVISDQQAIDEPLTPDSYEFVIETMATTETMTRIVGAVRPRGLIVIKSRQHTPVALDFNRLVHKDITLQAVNYGDFSEGIELVGSGQLQVDDLFGDIHPLDDFEDLFEREKHGENRKLFMTAARGPDTPT